MKKIIAVALISILITGCFNEKKETLNEQIVKDIDNIRIEETKEFEDLILLTDITIESEIGINKTDIESYVGKYSYPIDSKFYLVVKPKSNKKEDVQDVVESYINNLIVRIKMDIDLNPSMTDEEKAIINSKVEMLNNSIKEEYNGYLIYISSSNNEEVLSIIKDKLK